MQRYFVSLRIQSEYRKTRTRNNSLFGHFSRSVRKADGYEELKDIMKIDKSLEESDLLKQLKTKENNKQVNVLAYY